MKTIFVGDVTSELCDAAKAFDPFASLVAQENLSLPSGTCYVSLGDLPSIDSLKNILEKADTIIYHPPSSWSDEKNSFSYMQLWTEFYIMYFYHNNKKIIGIDKIKTNSISVDTVDKRKVETPQLWIAGCSISHGMGVSNEQRYGEIISKQLDLPVSFLTAPGGSNEWASEQILLSDIREGDILIFGLTSFNRFLYYTDKSYHINVSTYKEKPELQEIFNINLLNSNWVKYKSISHIHQVVNFCKKIKCKFIIAGIIIDEYDIFYIQNIPNYIQILGSTGMGNQRWVDVGTAPLHPGPLSHKLYAEILLKKLNDLS